MSSDSTDLVSKRISSIVTDRAVEICKVLHNYGMYEGFAAFGLYLHHLRALKEDEKTINKIFSELKNIMDGQAETHFIWMVLQEVMVYMTGKQTKEFAKKVFEEEE